MSVHFQSLSEITHRAKNALIQELGVVDTLRFLNQFRAGNGDYTVERLPEARIVASYGGETVLIPEVPGRSSTNMIETIRETGKS